VALCGDLLHGRTVHSLAFALARFGANVIFVPGDGNEIPGYVLRRLERDYHAHIRREGLGILGALFGEAPTSEKSATVDAIYLTPSEPHQLAMSSIEGTTVEFRVGSGESLSLYVTRRQTERGGAVSGAGRYPALTARALKASQFKDISILHPLPRVDELSPEVDQDPRSLYFRQAAVGIPVRMALLWHILGLGDEATVAGKQPYVQEVRGLFYSHPGFECSNETCVTNQERRFAHPQFEVVRNGDYKLRCLHCDQETAGAYVGNTESHFYYPSELLDRFAPLVRPEHVRFFRSSEAARLAGFKKTSDRWDSYHPKERDSGKHWLDMVSGRAR
jgi:aspartate carbamoyltransferase catalytic subunit